MSQSATTKDERFLVTLYQMASDAGSPTHPIDRYQIGKAIGQNDKGIDTIVRLLAQANFIQQKGEREVALTPHGLQLAKRLAELK